MSAVRQSRPQSVLEANSNERIAVKIRKSSIFGHFDFRPFLAKMGEMRFSKKRFPWKISFAKFQEKVMK